MRNDPATKIKRICGLVLSSVFCLVSFATPADKPAAAAPATDNDRAAASAAYEAGDFAKARRLWLPLAETGDARAQYALGRLYEKGRGVERDFAAAAAWYRKAAEQGHADSEYRLAVGYAYGLGVRKDEAAALAWLRKAANNGQKRAQKTLARAYEEGRLGLAADPKQAQYWYDKARSSP